MFAIQDFRDTSAAADDVLQVPPREALLLHTKQDGLYRIPQVHRVMLRFIGIDERGQHVEPVAFRRA